MNPQQLEEEIAKLSLSERASLIKRLLDGLGDYDADDSAEAVEAQWIAVAHERLGALEAGLALEISQDEALAEARSLIS